MMIDAQLAYLIALALAVASFWLTFVSVPRDESDLDYARAEKEANVEITPEIGPSHQNPGIPLPKPRVKGKPMRTSVRRSVGVKPMR